MADIVTNTEIKTPGRITTASYVQPCTMTLVNTTMPTTVARFQTRKIQRQSRPRPVDLTASLTSRTSQYTIAETYRLVRKSEKRYWNCPDGKRAYMWTGEQIYIPGLPVYDEPVLDWAEALRLQISDGVVNYAETIGEWRESISMMENGASVAKRAHQVARWLWRNRKNRKLLIKHLRKAGRWMATGSDNRVEFMDLVGADLAIKFGILPIGGLIEETIRALDLERARKFRKQVTKSKSIEASQVGPYGGVRSLRFTKSQRAIVYVTLKDTADNYTAGNLGEALWAGTRLSFMVDWFFNVSSYLQSLSALDEVSDVRGVLTTRRRWYGVDNASASNGFKAVRPGLYRRSQIDRSVITSIPLPRLRDNINPSFSLGKLLSATEVFASIRASLAKAN